MGLKTACTKSGLQTWIFLSNKGKETVDNLVVRCYNKEKMNLEKNYDGLE